MGFFLAEGLYTIVKVFYISIVDVSGKINAKRKGVPYKQSGKSCFYQFCSSHRMCRTAAKVSAELNTRTTADAIAPTAPGQ